MIESNDHEEEDNDSFYVNNFSITELPIEKSPSKTNKVLMSAGNANRVSAEL